MQSPLFKTFGFACALFLAGCASKPQIAVESRDGVDFTAFKTYGYVEQPGTDRESYTTILTSHFKRAVDKEMQARGYRYSTAEPDLQVNFFSNVENRTESYSTPQVSFGFFRSRSGVVLGVPLYGERVDTRNYKVGTVSIEVVDAERKELVWNGVLEGALSRKAMQNPASSVQTAVSQIFARYPVQGAGTAPAQ